MREVRVAGAAMTRFGRHDEASVRSLAAQASADALRDAGLAPAAVGLVCFANAAQGLLDGQEMIRGQAALRYTGLLGAPVINVENACASSATAFHLGWLAVAAELTDVALVIGAEKLTHPDRSHSLAAIGAALPLLDRGDDASTAPADRSVFMDIYAAKARELMARTGLTTADLARVAVKNRSHAALNPMAQYRQRTTVAEVLASRSVVAPLRLLMCAPVGDGAAALVLTSARVARGLAAPRVRVRATALVSGSDQPDQAAAVRRAAHTAAARAGIGPAEADVLEVHDATAPAELLLYEELELCPPGEAGAVLGEAWLGGRRPVNPSGGLLSRGHPIGATGCAQLVELTQQLRGRAGDRQVPGARVGLAQNGGGFLSDDVAAAAVTILST